MPVFIEIDDSDDEAAPAACERDRAGGGRGLRRGPAGGFELVLHPGRGPVALRLPAVEAARADAGPAPRPAPRPAAAPRCGGLWDGPCDFLMG